MAEVNLAPAETPKTGGAIHNQKLNPRLSEMPTFHHG